MQVNDPVIKLYTSGDSLQFEKIARELLTHLDFKIEKMGLQGE